MEKQINIRLQEALELLTEIGMPKAQQNERTALCLLALLNITPIKAWKQAEPVLIGITPIMDWSAKHYNKKYAPNTRETFRRQSIHQLVSAGFVNYNPDEPARPVNSPKAVYQVDENFLTLVRTYKSKDWKSSLFEYMENLESLVERYKRKRDQHKIPVTFKGKKIIELSAGSHSELMKDIVEDFAPRFAPNSELIYIGDTGAKTDFFDKSRLLSLGVELDSHGKLPDVVLYKSDRNWLYLIESVTSHGPVDNKRYDELTALFKGCTADIIFVSAFPDRSIFTKYLQDIAWESEVWIADNPSHMIHFNGDKFLGPYKG